VLAHWQKLVEHPSSRDGQGTGSIAPGPFETPAVTRNALARDAAPACDGRAGDKPATVADVLDSRPRSVRLDNCLRNNRRFFSGWQIDAVERHRDEFQAELLRTPKLGLKTLDEVMEVVEAYIAAPWIVQEVRAPEFPNQAEAVPPIWSAP
jgi:hypothetical protein